ncbi:MAG: LysM peptidoglycan-binding domain-containing protein, partial [Anaerolineae bacterium]|nr:LysM peptidoglycan-binding domain-containing protein [Anaerolineae bacterium]
ELEAPDPAFVRLLESAPTCAELVERPFVNRYLAPRTYTVVTGDTLSGIAFNFGVDINQLMRQNDIINPGNLSVGRVLTIAPPPVVEDPFAGLELPAPLTALSAEPDVFF